MRGVIYHYTNQRGLLGILKHDSLWCTDIRFLNDSRELVHTLDFAKDLLESRAESLTTPRAKLYDDWAKRLWQLKDYPLYVISFSEESDLLSQWRAYSAPTGFAIGFDAFALKRWVEALQWPGDMLKCIYDTGEQREHLEYAMDFLGDLYEENGASSNTAAAYFFRFLMTAAACFKNPGFAEEKEWRLVLRAVAKGAVKQFRPGTGTVIPYVDLPLDDPRALVPIIIAGPSPSPSLSGDALDELVTSSNLGLVTTRGSSKIPYRAYT